MNEKLDKIVSCANCTYSGEVINFLTTCGNKEGNPKEVMKGTYERKCKFFVEKCSR